MSITDALTGQLIASRQVAIPTLSVDIECNDLIPNIGTSGTPVIDPDTSVMYFYSKTYLDQSGSVTGRYNERYHMHAVRLNTSDLVEMENFPVAIEGGPAQNSGFYFVAGIANQRTGLVRMNNDVIYAGFGSHCEISIIRAG